MGDAVLYYLWPLVYGFVVSLLVHAICARLTPRVKRPARLEVVLATCISVCVAGLLFYQEQGVSVYPLSTEAFAISLASTILGVIAYVVDMIHENRDGAGVPASEDVPL